MRRPGLYRDNWLFVLGMLALIGVFWRHEDMVMYKAHVAKRWPTADATVVQVEEAPVGGRYCKSRLAFRYRYTVGGREYTGSNYAFDSVCSHAEIGYIIATNPAGSHTQVHYDPEHVQDSVIKPGRSRLDAQFGILGILIQLGLVLVVLCADFESD